MTPKRMNRTRTHWRKVKRIFSIPISSAWLEMAKNTRWKNAKLAQKELAQIVVDLLGV